MEWKKISQRKTLQTCHALKGRLPCLASSDPPWSGHLLANNLTEVWRIKEEASWVKEVTREAQHHLQNNNILSQMPTCSKLLRSSQSAVICGEQRSFVKDIWCRLSTFVWYWDWIVGSPPQLPGHYGFHLHWICVWEEKKQPRLKWFHTGDKAQMGDPSLALSPPVSSIVNFSFSIIFFFSSSSAIKFSFSSTFLSSNSFTAAFFSFT